MSLLFMDSGAYSAWTQKVHISLERYAAFLKQNTKVIDIAANLDVIGGTEVANWDNQRKLEDLSGRPILPVFHFHENPGVLRDYVKHYDYLALGGLVGRGTLEQEAWLDKIWREELTDAEGYPLVKVHGFGLTSVPLMKRYPWYSVDSTSWNMMGATGKVLLVRPGPELVIVTVSKESPLLHKADLHIETMPEEWRVALITEIGTHGFTVDQLRNEWRARKIFNALAYLKFAKQVPYRPMEVQQTSLFDLDREPKRKKVDRWEHLQMFAASGGTAFAVPPVIREGGNVLISYHYIVEGNSKWDWDAAQKLIKRERGLT